MLNRKSKIGLIIIILILGAIVLSGCEYSWPHLPSPTAVVESVINGVSNFGQSLKDMFQGFGGSINF